MVSEFTGAHNKKTKIEICGKPRKRLTAVKVLAIMRLRLNVDEPLMYSQLLGYHSAHTMHHRIIRISGIQF